MCSTCCSYKQTAVGSVVSVFLPVRFIRLRDNLPKGRREEKNPKKEKKKKRWREHREKEEVKDSREKEFIETYITSLKDRGESYGGPEGQN